MRVLVADDKEQNVYLLRALLAGHGFDVLVARNGAEALALAAREKPDLVISDILMPVMDGFTLCRRWRADRALRGVPFVFYTATYTEERDERLAMSLGADRFIVKPQEPERFLAEISAVLEEHRRGALQARDDPAPPEEQYLREYSAVLVRKLEDKLVDLADANRLLAAKDAFNQAVLDAMTALVAVTGPRGEVLSVNRSWAAFPRREGSPSLLRARPGESLLAGGGEDAPDTEAATRRVREGLREVLEGRAADRDAELPWRLSGDERWFFVRVEKVGAAGAGAVVACMDITERKRAAQALEEAARRKDDFLALLGHELRNPLAPIRTASRVLRQLRGDEPDVARAGEVIDRQVAHLAHIVDDLLDVSRIARGRLAVEYAPVDLARVVRGTVEDWRGGFDARGVELRARLPEGPLWVRGDETRLAQVAANLLSNAEKFTDRGGRVEVELEAEGAGRCRLVVRDTGVGMTAETLARVFEPFEQAPQDAARVRGGLGMGLALVRGLVALHGGEVSASSAGPGRGSELVVRLPSAPAPERREAAAAAAPVAGTRVLIVEDNADVADTLRAFLELAGCAVEVAFDGPEGLAKARAQRPDIVLCDLGLPGGMDGLAVARALRADPELGTASLVALTGYGQADDRRRTREAGFDAHVTKPADLDDLLALVGRARERAQA